MVEHTTPHPARTMIRSLTLRGALLKNLVRADLRERYSGSVVGWLWGVLHPAAQILVYGVVFSVVMSGRGQGFARPMDYVLYLCIGLFPWLAFSEAISRSASILVSGAAQLRQGIVQEEMLPAKVTASAAVSMACALGVLLAASPLLGLAPAATWLLLPIPLVALMVLALGLGMICAVLTVFFRDLVQVVQILLPVALWTTPIIYVQDILPHGLVPWLPWHPLYAPFTILHDLYLRGCLPDPRLWVALLCWPAIVLTFAGFLTSRLRSEVRDAL